MSSATAKWFDLSDHEAKLERHQNDSGSHYKLILEVPTERVEPVLANTGPKGAALALLDLGWEAEDIGENRLRLTNHAPLNRKSEIVTSLRPFFTEAEIEDSHIPAHALQQGEIVEGLQSRQVITQEELAQDIEGVSESDFDRIIASVKKAQELQAERHKKQTMVLFHGVGRATFDHLTDEIIRLKELPEPEAAFLACRSLVEAARQPQSVHAVRMTELARCIADERWEQAETGVSYAIGRIGITDDDWEDAVEDVSLDGMFQVTSSTMTNMEYGPHVSFRDVILRESSDLSPFMMDAVTVTVPAEQAYDIYKERIPFMVIRDSSVPSKMLAQSMTAVDAALDIVASELELPRDKLMPRQKEVPVRFSFDAVSGDRRTMGMVQSIERETAPGETADEDDRSAVAMNLSVTQGGTFLHELGHLIDRGNSLTDQERHDILSNAGVLDLAQAAVDREFPFGGIYAEYLLSESEIFARTFDAHFVNLAREQGDRQLQGLCGLHTTRGIDRAAPFGDLEKSSAFIASLKDTLSLRREARHEARQRTDVENMAEASAPASFGMD